MTLKGTSSRSADKATRTRTGSCRIKRHRAQCQRRCKRLDSQLSYWANDLEFSIFLVNTIIVTVKYSPLELFHGLAFRFDGQQLSRKIKSMAILICTPICYI